MVKVSVCTPVYNGEKYFAKTIESVLNQSFTDFEYIISDNNSTDGTVEIVQSFKDDRIILLHRDETSPMYPNFNNCLKHATGTYVKFLLSDDFFLSSNSLARYVDVMEKNPSVGLASCIALRITSSGKFIDIYGSDFEHEYINRIKNFIPENFNITFESFLEIEDKIGKAGIKFPDYYFNGQKLVNTVYRIGSDIYGQTPTHTIFRRDLIDKVGYFNEDIPSGWGTDSEYWYRFMSCSDFIKIMHPLVIFRRHDSSGTSKVEKNQEQVPTMGFYWKKMKKDYHNILTPPNIFLGYVSIIYYSFKIFSNQLIKRKKFELSHLVEGFKFNPVAFMFTLVFLPLIMLLKRYYPKHF